MTIKIRYFIFIIIIHLVIIVLSFKLLKEQKLYFFLIEIGVIISLFFAYRIYKSFIEPLQFLAAGADAILDKDFSINYVKTGSKEMDKLVDVFNNMIKNIRKERVQVEEQHYFLQNLINASPSGIIILDYDEKITDMNPKAMSMLDIKENWQQKDIQTLSHPLLKDISSIEIGAYKVVSLQGVEQFKIEVSHFIHRGFKRKFILIQELSREILAAEKRAYGKVIRMMAHEVNNSIGAINSILNSSIEYLEEDENQDQSIKDALQIAVDRNYNLNQFMRNFASVIRLPQPHLERVDIVSIVKKVADLMQHQASERNIKFTFDFPNKIIWCQLDTQQIEQALVNIIKNALESIIQEGQIHFQITENPLCLKISDDGEGINKEAVEKLFTPFFSTKPTGQGVGLTLIREILLNHNAQFSLKNNINKGATFEIKY